MSAQQEMSEGSAGIPRGSTSVDPNIYVLSEAIRAYMETSIELLSAALQKNVLVMANTIQEGFAARPSIEGFPYLIAGDSSGSLRKKCQSMVREACTAQVVVASPSQSDREGADDDVSLLDHTHFLTQSNRQCLPFPLWIGLPLISWWKKPPHMCTRPPLSEAMALRVGHMLKTPLLPEKLKFHMPFPSPRKR